MLTEVLEMMSPLPRQAVLDWSEGSVRCAQACCDPLCEFFQMHSWPGNLSLGVDRFIPPGLPRVQMHSWPGNLSFSLLLLLVLGALMESCNECSLERAHVCTLHERCAV